MTIQQTLRFVAVVALCAQGAGQAAPEIHYRSSYPPKERPPGVREIPEGAWTDEIKGLRAAISAPEKVSYFERFQMYVVVQNVSKKPVQVTFPALAIHPYLTPVSQPVATGGYSNNNCYERWEISPGEEIAVPFPPKTVVRGKGIVYPTHAIRDIEPGPHHIACHFGAGGEGWEKVPGSDEARRVVYPEHEWQGGFKLKPARIEVLDADAELEFVAPPELGTDHGLEPTLERPELRGVAFELRYGLYLNADRNRGAGAHWLVDASSYSSRVHWGPCTTETLEKTELLDVLEDRIRKKLADGYRHNDGLSEMAKLGSLRQPFLGIMFDLAEVMGEPEKGRSRFSHDGMARQLRNRRVELREMGLSERAETALKFIATAEQPLPAKDRFKVISADANPPDAPEDGWGPVNAGLQAAALMPPKIVHRKAVEARLFIRNASNKPVFMSLSKGGGYDYLHGEGSEGEPLEIKCPLNYPRVFSGVIRPTHTPGVCSTVYYEGSILDLFKIEPGAIWELKTKTGIRYYKPGEKQDAIPFQFGQPFPSNDSIWTTTITSAPGKVKLRWKLNSANGTEFKKDSRKRYWPAKGGWIGILETAPVEIELTEKVSLPQ